MVLDTWDTLEVIMIIDISVSATLNFEPTFCTRVG